MLRNVHELLRMAMSRPKVYVLLVLYRTLFYCTTFLLRCSPYAGLSIATLLYISTNWLCSRYEHCFKFSKIAAICRNEVLSLYAKTNPSAIKSKRYQRLKTNTFQSISFLHFPSIIKFLSNYQQIRIVIIIRLFHVTHSYTYIARYQY